MEVKDLKIELAKTFEEFKSANDKAIGEAEKRNGEATAETRSQVEALNNAITELKKEIGKLEVRSNRPPKLDKSGKETTPEMELRTRAYEKYIRHGIGETSGVTWTPEETRALAGTADDDGQFLVPDGFESAIIMAAYDIAEVRPLCQVGTTSRDVVKLGSLSKPIVAWGTRGLAVDQQSLNTGGVTIPIKNIRALTLLSNDTLDDAAADVMGQLEMAFELAVAEAEDDSFIAGSDPKGPGGILANASVLANVTNSGVAANIYDGTHNGIDALKTMLYGLKKAYRRNATWAMNSTTEGAYRSLKDGEGRYLWDFQVAGDGAGTLLGRPVINPEAMADIAAGTYPVLLGDFRSGYKIRDRAGLTIKRLVERYAEYDQTAFILKKRVGGQVTLPEAFRCLKVSA